MHIIIINGPNLNLLGKREPDVYGTLSFEDYLLYLKNEFKEVTLDYFQSNVEGELINKLHDCGYNYNGIILNAGAYSHSSIAIADAITAICVPVIEVHISNIFAREDYRQISMLAKSCKGSISGFGLQGYKLAIQSFIS